jgi:hypothetical protein
VWLTSHPDQFIPGKLSRYPLIPQLVWTFWGREKLLFAEVDKEKRVEELVKFERRKIRTT